MRQKRLSKLYTIRSDEGKGKYNLSWDHLSICRVQKRKYELYLLEAQESGFQV